MEKPVETFWYTIDSENKILSYSRNFEPFARTNGWHYFESITGKNLFDFIEGMEVQHIYKILFEFVRQGKSIGPIPFRCDSPSQRRYLELYLYPLPEGSINIVTRLLRTEHRKPVTALMPNIERSDEIIVMCSMCKKIKLEEGLWKEIEEALKILRLFDVPNPPRISHGLCEDCFANVMAEIKRQTAQEMTL